MLAISKTGLSPSDRKFFHKASSRNKSVTPQRPKYFDPLTEERIKLNPGQYHVQKALREIDGLNQLPSNQQLSQWRDIGSRVPAKRLNLKSYREYYPILFEEPEAKQFGPSLLERFFLVGKEMQQEAEKRFSANMVIVYQDWKVI
ncbi:MAG: hypothetical protein SFU25_00405 [Candidatus Caenarcaniphilales bacterium]|nr:hypothetical protein [Candidatus Caenarcaniphilales bacterium]